MKQKRKGLLLLAVLFSIGTWSSGQIQLQKRWYDDLAEDPNIQLMGVASAPADDNGVITCAEVVDSGGNVLQDGGIFVMKVDSNGESFWAKRFTFPGGEYYNVTQMIRNSYGEYLVTGKVQMDDGDNHAFILEVDANGVKQWDRLYEEDTYSNSIIQCRDKSTGDYVDQYVIVGSRDDSSSNDVFLWVAKVYAGGALIWNRIYDYEDSQQEEFSYKVRDVGYDIIQTDDIELVSTSPPLFGHDGIQDDGYVITGVQSKIAVGHEYHDLIIVKLDNNGFLTDWSTYADNGGERSIGLSILETDDDGNGLYDDGYIVAGFITSIDDVHKGRFYIPGGIGGNRDGLVLNVGDDLWPHWDKRYYRTGAGSTPAMTFFDMTAVGEYYYIAGSYFGQQLVKIDQNGAVGGALDWSGASNMGIEGDGYHVFKKDSILMVTGYESNSIGWGIDLSQFTTKMTSNGCKDESVGIETSAPGVFPVEEDFELVDPFDNMSHDGASGVTMYLKDRHHCGLELKIRKKLTTDPDVLTGLTNGSGFEFRITREDGVEIIVSTDANGVWEGNLDNLYDYEVSERFKPDYIPVQPRPAKMQLDSGLTDSTCKFYNHEVDNWCEQYEGMVAYLHFQERDGDETLNVMGPNGIFRRNDNGNLVTGSGVIGWDVGDMVVKTTTGAVVPFMSNRRTFYLKKDGVNKTSDNVYIEVPNYSEIEEIGDDEFTVEYYLRVDTILTPGGQGGIIQKENRDAQGNPIEGWDMDVHRSGSTNKVDIYSEFHGSNGPVGSDSKWGSALTMGTMSHVVMVKKDIGIDSFNLELYINGVSKGVKTVYHNQGVSFETTAPLEILPHSWKGVMDELSIYNRALSEDEIDSIYANGKCWDYVRFNEYTSDCYSSSVAEGSVVIYNGHLNDHTFRYALAALPFGTPLPDGSGNSNADGPARITENHGTVTINETEHDTIFYSIPCRDAYHGYSSVYQITVFNDTEWIELGMKTTHSGKSLQPEPAKSGEDDHNLASRIIASEEASPYLIYPNPAKGQITIQADMKTSMVSLHSLDGRTVIGLQALSEGTHSLDISSLNSGMYIIRLSSEEHGVVSYRFMKE